MIKINHLLIGIICLILIVAILLFFQKTSIAPNNIHTQNDSQVQSNDQTIEQKNTTEPIDDPLTRIIKKPFGIFITPKTSSVQPERFSGFHTGTDFETFPSEADIDVPFYSICAGKILQKRTATGYGGILIQSCTINNLPVTVIYGHIKLVSVLKNIGDELLESEKIGFLGQPPTETSSERKHLHLGIHLGTTTNILGYVKNQIDLSNWLDWQKLSE